MRKVVGANDTISRRLDVSIKWFCLDVLKNLRFDCLTNLRRCRWNRVDSGSTKCFLGHTERIALAPHIGNGRLHEFAAKSSSSNYKNPNIMLMCIPVRCVQLKHLNIITVPIFPFTHIYIYLWPHACSCVKYGADLLLLYSRASSQSCTDLLYWFKGQHFWATCKYIVRNAVPSSSLSSSINQVNDNTNGSMHLARIIISTPEIYNISAYRITTMTTNSILWMIDDHLLFFYGWHFEVVLMLFLK